MHIGKPKLDNIVTICSVIITPKLNYKSIYRNENQIATKIEKNFSLIQFDTMNFFVTIQCIDTI